MSQKAAYIYFMTNEVETVLYIGVTSNLIRRIAEHKADVSHGFTRTYNCKKLVYYEHGTSIADALQREKQLKRWKRVWKNELVNEFNPSWTDLSHNIGVTSELVAQIAANAESNTQRQDPGSSPG